MTNERHSDATGATGAALDTAVVITGAAPLHRRAVAAIPTGAATLVIAADGGLDHALAAGIEPRIVVGDLDSISADGLAWATAHAEVVRHHTDKDDTDTEIALAAAVAVRPRRLLMISGGTPYSGRLDHVLATIGALGDIAASSDGSVESALDRVEGWIDDTRILTATPRRHVELDRRDAPDGATFSVLALHGTATGVGITGARWPLVDATLDAISGRGVSNQVAQSPVRVSVDHGVVTVVIPPPEPANHPHHGMDTKQ